jgi:GR25 family glycosyltransferase involved in LPS biosynthesis
MTEQFEKYNIQNYEFIDGFTNKSPETELYYQKYKNNFLSIENKSQIAIALGHLEIAKKIYENKYTCCAIIEDDIRLTEKYTNIIEEYLTPEVINILDTEPCVLHLACGPSLKTNNPGLYKLDHVVGICFNIINYQMAELIINNFEPLEYQYDTFLHFLCKKNRITELVAIPLLGWDLSSKMYKKLWSEEDKEINSKLQSLSKIKDE